MYIPKEILIISSGFAIMKVIDAIIKGKKFDAEMLVALVFSTSMIVIVLVILNETYQFLMKGKNKQK